MSQKIVESIFVARKNLENLYPQTQDIKTFDLHKKHGLYGRIDRDGDAIILDDSNLKQLVGGRTETSLAVDFVCEAFRDLSTNVKRAANAGFVSKESLFPSNLRAFKSWPAGDLEYNYNQYINKLYTNFVDSYLQIDRRHEKIKNYRDFVREFVRYYLRIADNFPVTKTGYIMSNHCSPFISGLMLEVAPEQHGINSFLSQPGFTSPLENYINDASFQFFVNEVKKFGFMVDKNAPWRLVFNLASGQQEKEDTQGQVLSGGQMYMDKYAVTFETVFDTYYRKAYLDELQNLRKQFFSLYESFYKQFSTYEQIEYFSGAYGGDCRSMRIVVSRKDRVPLDFADRGGASIKGLLPAKNDDTKHELVKNLPKLIHQDNEFWLNLFLKMRLAETKTHHDNKDFQFYRKQMVNNYRIFGLPRALKYINDLTKGMKVSNFLSKGSYWYGISAKEYEKRKRQILEEAADPSRADYALTATANNQ